MDVPFRISNFQHYFISQMINYYFYYQYIIMNKKKLFGNKAVPKQQASTDPSKQTSSNNLPVEDPIEDPVEDPIDPVEDPPIEDPNEQDPVEGTDPANKASSFVYEIRFTYRGGRHEQMQRVTASSEEEALQFLSERGVDERRVVNSIEQVSYDND